ncbi:MAG: FAD:protein FMN transferase [Deltaproteobacteria bacterium]|nr:FAD:protein FMN transferase [Deltaproteobacteria bacterium]
MTNLSRRSFVRLSGLAALALTGRLARPPEALAARLTRGQQILRRSRLLMGTYVTITVIDPSLTRAEEAVENTFAEIVRLERILSRYQASGPLTHLNTTGRLAHPDPELVAVLSAARSYHDLSGGAFDATVAPVVDALKAHFERDGGPPPRAELAALLKRVDGGAVEVSTGEIRLLKEGLALTLDGLAKGYIVDLAVQKLAFFGIEGALINAGGDIRALGQKGRAPWRVAVLDPTQAHRKGPIIDLADESIATSGNYEVFYDTEKLHHHIIDPASGRSPISLVSVSVRAASCLVADALSTTIFCLAPRQGLGLLDRLGASGLIIDRAGHRLSRGAWG